MEQNVNLPTTYTPAPEYQTPAPAAANTSIFADMTSFEGAQRVCKMLASSDLVPTQFRGNIANTMIALEMANRANASPFMVMQNLYVVHGRPGFSATYIIAAINSCGRFSPLRFEFSGEGDDWGCVAWVIEKATGDRLEGSRVDIKMAKREGWYDKNGSKWKTMPDQMLRYRAAAFFGRIYAPDILMGMQTVEELRDTGGGAAAYQQARGQAQADVVEAEGVVVESGPASVAEINAMLQAKHPQSDTPPAPQKEGPETNEPVQEEGGEAEAGRTEANAAPPAEAKEEKKENAQEQAQEEDPTAEYRRLMMGYIAEIDGLKTLTELQWWANTKGYKRLQDELGGKESEWYLAVIEHQEARIEEMKAASAKRGK